MRLLFLNFLGIIFLSSSGYATVDVFPGRCPSVEEFHHHEHALKCTKG